MMPQNSSVRNNVAGSSTTARPNITMNRPVFHIGSDYGMPHHPSPNLGSGPMSPYPGQYPGRAYMRDPASHRIPPMPNLQGLPGGQFGGSQNSQFRGSPAPSQFSYNPSHGHQYPPIDYNHPSSSSNSPAYHGALQYSPNLGSASTSRNPRAGSEMLRRDSLDPREGPSQNRTQKRKYRDDESVADSEFESGRTGPRRRFEREQSVETVENNDMFYGEQARYVPARGGASRGRSGRISNGRSQNQSRRPSPPPRQARRPPPRISGTVRGALQNQNQYFPAVQSDPNGAADRHACTRNGHPQGLMNETNRIIFRDGARSRNAI